jgi:Mrp family chromosome partitioning ATPase
MRRSSVQNSAVTDSPAVDVSHNDAETAYAMRGGLLFTQAAIVLLTGLLVPIPPIAIDVLLAVNLVFTAMLLFVALTARDPAEITSVPPVAVFITLLRLGTNVAAAKSIILIANGGRIIDWCGTHIYYGVVSIIIAAILVLVICVVICKAAIFIRRKAIGYLAETIPNRQATLDTEFQNGTLTYDQMLRARNRIERQKKFFAGMASTSSLLLCDGVIAVIITLATIFGATVIGIMNASAIMAGSPQYSPLALAVALTTAVPALLVALALGVLINKRFLLSLKVQSPIAKTIHIDEPAETFYSEDHAAAAMIPPTLEAIEAEPLPDELPNMNVAEFADSIQIPEQELNEILTDDIPFEQPVIEEIETEADPQIIEPPTEELLAAPMLAEEFANEPQAAYQEIESPVGDEVTVQAASTEIVRDDYYYDSILAVIGDKSKASMLLAGESISQLPITIAVELAIHIIQVGKRCLLIDMDPTRNAVATAFEIDSASMQGKAVPTGITHLWISPADDPDNPAAVKLSRKVANALKVFDYVVIYAPNAAAQNVQDQLAGVSDAAIIFGMSDETASLEEFSKTLVLWGCRTVFEYNLLKKNA